MDSTTAPSTAALVWRAIGLLVAVALARFFYRLHQVRTLVRRFHKETGLDHVPHSYLLGHLVETGKVMAPYPRNMYPLCLGALMLRKYPHLEKNGFILLDAWPITETMIYVFDPEMSAQFTQLQSQPKSELVKSEFRQLTQNRDLVTMDGQAWKFWRSVFNPGFSAKNLISMTPAFLEEVKVYTDRLRQAAKTGEVLKLEDPTVNLTIDVIGRSILNTRMHCQTTENPLQWALAKQISWLIPEYTPPSLLKLINPARPFLVWNYNRIIRNYLLPIIHRQVVVQANGSSDGTADVKTVLSLAAKAYLAEKPQSGKPSSSTGAVDEEFISMTIPQLVIFLFAGHDTTATTLCYAYNLLNKNPSTLAALRAEHDAVLGPDPHQAESVIAANPQLLNALPYTSAVIKETLRLYPPAATVRQGSPAFYLTHPTTGQRFPTAGLMVLQSSHTTHHLASLFPRPEDFVPERFLAAEGEPLYVRKNSFRPFELGPRGCIGQELALLELRMILALTAREFQLEMVEPEGLPEIFKEQGTYPVGNVTGHPLGGMPVRVKVRA